MATPQKDKESSEEATKKAEEKPKKQTQPRKPRRKPYQMTTVVVAKETALLPEPLRASVVAMAHAIIRFFQRAWQEITAALTDEPVPRLLPPVDRDEGNEQ
jgi:hypothetical protein